MGLINKVLNKMYRWYIRSFREGSIYIPIIVQSVSDDPPTFTLIPQLRFDKEEMFSAILSSFGDILMHYIQEVNDMMIVCTEHDERDFYYNPMTGLFLLRIGYYKKDTIYDISEITRPEYSDMERLFIIRGNLTILKGILLGWCPNIKVV